MSSHRHVPKIYKIIGEGLSLGLVTKILGIVMRSRNKDTSMSAQQRSGKGDQCDRLRYVGKQRVDCLPVSGGYRPRSRC